MKIWRQALVTGAAKGIGKALCQQLLGAGVVVTAIDRDDIDWADSYTSKQLKVIKINLINSNSVNDVVSQLITSDGFDLVIHNAGISATGKFEEIDPKAYENVLMLNTQVPMQLSIQFLKNEVFAPKAKLVFISSLSHATGYPGASVYGASKDAIAVYARSIRKPFAKLGVSVLAVFPGPVRTEHAERHAPEGADATKRMQPEELAGKILVAASGNGNVLYPSGTAKTARILGAIAPKTMTNLMRKIIYNKLDKPVW